MPYPTVKGRFLALDHMKKTAFSLLAFLMHMACQAQNFDLIPLGIYGGEQEDNLSAYLMGAPKDSTFLSLDAGTINTGIRKAIQLKSLNGPEETVLKKPNKRIFYLTRSFGSFIRSYYQFSG